MSAMDSTEPQEPTSAARAKPQPPIDVPLALERVDGDMELLEELVATFLDDLPTTLRALGEAVDREDHVETRRLAHGLRGSLASLAAMPAAGLAQQVEDFARDKRGGDAAKAWIPFEQEMARVRACFSAPGWNERAEKTP